MGSFCSLALPYLYRSIGEYHFIDPLFARTMRDKPHFGSMVKRLDWVISMRLWKAERTRLHWPSPSDHRNMLDRSISVLGYFKGLRSLSITFEIHCAPKDQPIPEDLAIIGPDGFHDILPSPEQLSTISLPSLSAFQLDNRVGDVRMGVGNSWMMFEATVPWLTLDWFRRSCNLQTLSLKHCTFDATVLPWQHWAGLRCLFVAAPIEDINLGQFISTLEEDASIMLDYHRIETDTADVFNLILPDHALDNVTALTLWGVEAADFWHDPLAMLFPQVRYLALMNPVMHDGYQDDFAFAINQLFPPSSPCPKLEHFHWDVRSTYSLLTGPEEPKPIDHLLDRFTQQEFFPKFKFCFFAFHLDDLIELQVISEEFGVAAESPDAEKWTAIHSRVKDDFGQLVGKCPSSAAFEIRYSPLLESGYGDQHSLRAISPGEVESLVWPK